MNYKEALEATRSHSNRSYDEEGVFAGTGGCNGPVLGTSKLCPQKKGTLLRIFIPPGAEINLLDLIEIASPGGICIIVRLPFLENLCGKNNVAGIFDSIKRAGGKIEFV